MEVVVVVGFHMAVNTRFIAQQVWERDVKRLQTTPIAFEKVEPSGEDIATGWHTGCGPNPVIVKGY